MRAVLSVGFITTRGSVPCLCLCRLPVYCHLGACSFRLHTHIRVTPVQQSAVCAHSLP